jgi:hypothetical protein
MRLHPGSVADTHTISNEVAVSRAPRGRVGGKIPAYLRGGPHAEGVTVGPNERKLSLAPRVDRSHRRTGGRRRRPPPWTLGEKAVLVLSLALIFAGVVLAVVLFVLST